MNTKIDTTKIKIKELKKNQNTIYQIGKRLCKLCKIKRVMLKNSSFNKDPKKWHES